MGFTGIHSPLYLIWRPGMSSSCNRVVIELPSECGLTPRTSSGLEHVVLFAECFTGGDYCRKQEQKLAQEALLSQRK
ncbi:hypothetical protein ACMD2_14479 [Ananas comosus]|uniref:Uncharacterized protein n=1 Tax=Ananas comosus TaxID=4615 RepID=A0A199W8S7_ANACO|nr:hypothetical protein ACMD2_14479 [Ananas comosus]